MTIVLDQVVPWGRSFDEYVAMFALDATDLQGRILGCGDGPAAFNAVATRRGVSVTSIDPLYRFNREAISGRIQQTRHTVIEQMRVRRNNYVWTSICSVEALERTRLAAMQAFLEDFEEGSASGRYVIGGLPKLPSADGEFDLALCSHFLFLYSEHHDEIFHLAALRELLRVAGEVRVFPLLTLAGGASPHLATVMHALRDDGHRVEVRRVDYEFQKGGNEMLRIMRGRAH